MDEVNGGGLPPDQPTALAKTGGGDAVPPPSAPAG